jgi:hypothetical protein
VDLSLHKLAVVRRKHLMRVALFRQPNSDAELLMDANKL